MRAHIIVTFSMLVCHGQGWSNYTKAAFLSLWRHNLPSKVRLPNNNDFSWLSMTKKFKFHDRSGDCLKRTRTKQKCKFQRKNNISFFVTVQKEPLVLVLFKINGLLNSLQLIARKNIPLGLWNYRSTKHKRLISLGTLSKCQFKTSNCK